MRCRLFLDEKAEWRGFPILAPLCNLVIAPIEAVVVVTTTGISCTRVNDGESVADELVVEVVVGLGLEDKVDDSLLGKLTTGTTFRTAGRGGEKTAFKNKKVRVKKM